MKKLVISLIVGASMIFASSAFALQAMTDSTMKDTTAQAGVGITLDDILVEIWSSGSKTYTDTDGYSGSDKIFLYTILGGSSQATPGWGDSATSLRIDSTDSHRVIKLNGITGFTNGAFTSPGLGLIKSAEADVTLTANHATGNAGAGVADVFMAKALTIDVGNCTVYAEGLNNNLITMGAGAAANQTIGGVVIGLPTVEVNIVDDAGTKTYYVDKEGAINNGSAYIATTSTRSERTIHLLGGKIEIAPH